MNLLLDIGNSRLKWAMSDGNLLSQHGSTARNEQIFEALDNAWQQIPTPQSIVASNVAGDLFAQQLREWIKTRWALEIKYVTVKQGWQGLEIAYAQPQLFGVDRWLALIAARQLYSGALCVIDAGTAVTIDAVDATGKHRGGVILPGIELMQRTLQQRSAGVSRGMQTSSTMHPGVLGCDTRSGIERGTLYAVAGAIIHTHSRIKSEIGTPITTIITGGDAEHILAEIGSGYHHTPHLPLYGLQQLIER